MSNQRLTSLRKKPVAPPPQINTARQPPKPPKKIQRAFLYYAHDCLFCKELIRILVMIPDLAHNIKCININEYEVDPAIDSIPTVDEGNDETGRKLLHKLENAFTWVLHQCYLLQDEHGDRVLPVTVAEIESQVKKVFHQLQVDAGGQIKDKNIMRQNTDVNPRDRYKTTSADATDTFAPFDYSGKQRSKEQYNRRVQEQSTVPRSRKSIEERMKAWENDRQQTLNAYKAEWEKQGGEKLSATIKRDSLKGSMKGVTEKDMRSWETERMRMLEDITKRYSSEMLEPVKRQTFRMGTNISETDVKNYEKQREQMVAALHGKGR